MNEKQMNLLETCNSRSDAMVIKSETISLVGYFKSSLYGSASHQINNSNASNYLHTQDTTFVLSSLFLT